MIFGRPVASFARDVGNDGEWVEVAGLFGGSDGRVTVQALGQVDFVYHATFVVKAFLYTPQIPFALPWRDIHVVGSGVIRKTMFQASIFLNAWVILDPYEAHTMLAGADCVVERDTGPLAFLDLLGFKSFPGQEILPEDMRAFRVTNGLAVKLLCNVCFTGGLQRACMA